jgi:small subunit ribosomal protein S17
VRRPDESKQQKNSSPSQARRPFKFEFTKMPKRIVQGVVTGDKMSKTRRVELDRLSKHPVYKKYVRSKTICYAHDENNESSVGDKVEIIESQPLSKLKRWRLVRIVAKSTDVDVAALRAARKVEVAEGIESAAGEAS